jgi:hypothetical protein
MLDVALRFGLMKHAFLEPNLPEQALKSLSVVML